MGRLFLIGCPQAAGLSFGVDDINLSFFPAHLDPFRVTHYQRPLHRHIRRNRINTPALNRCYRNIWEATAIVSSERWEAALLLMVVTLMDLFGGYAVNMALSRRMVEVGTPA
jgi:hypothetical protein